MNSKLTLNTGPEFITVTELQTRFNVKLKQVHYDKVQAMVEKGIDLETWEFHILGKIVEVNVIIKDSKYAGVVIPHSIKLYKAYKIRWIMADNRNKVTPTTWQDPFQL